MLLRRHGLALSTDRYTYHPTAEEAHRAAVVRGRVLRLRASVRRAPAVELARRLQGAMYSLHEISVVLNEYGYCPLKAAAWSAKSLYSTLRRAHDVDVLLASQPATERQRITYERRCLNCDLVFASFWPKQSHCSKRCVLQRSRRLRKIRAQIAHFK